MNLSFLGAFNWSTILYIFIAILVFLLMILIHELGHYIAGRILKFKINEFSIGFGKAIFQKTNKRGEKISLRIFPLGGYCAFEGEGEVADKVNPQAFNNQKPWKRLIVLFSGAFFNFLSAILFCFILLISFGYDIMYFTGDPSTYDSRLQTGDVIYQVNETDVNFATNGTMASLIREVGIGNEFSLTVKRYNEETNKYERLLVEDITLQENPDDATLIAFPEFSSYPRPFFEALGGAFVLAIMMAWVVLKSLWLLITFKIPISQIGGPIATVSLIATYTQSSIVNLFILLPLISANLAMFNLLPFPALDGAQMVFTGVEWIRRKPINQKVQGIINMCGLIFLLTFVVVIDILHFVL